MTPSVDHVAIVVRSLDEALSFYRDALGLTVTERREVPEEGVEIASLALANGSVELVRPLGSEGGIANFLDSRGEGLHHICLVVQDIAAAMKRLREAGALPVTDEPQVAADGTRYVFVHPKSAHGVLLELYEEPA